MRGNLTSCLIIAAILISANPLLAQESVEQVPQQVSVSETAPSTPIATPDIASTQSGLPTPLWLSADPAADENRIVGVIVSVDPLSNSLIILASSVQLPRSEPISINPPRKKVVVTAPDAAIESGPTSPAHLGDLTVGATISATGFDMGQGRPQFASDIMLQGAQGSVPSATTSFSGLDLPPKQVNVTIENLEPWLQDAVSSYPNTAQLMQLAVSPGGRPVVCVKIAQSDCDVASLHRIVVLFRQHGDEPETTRAGALLIYRLLTTIDAPTLTALDRCAVYIIPIVNPDGAAALHRTNSVSQDLNRMWYSPPSPEIQGVRSFITQLRPDVVIDVHQWVPGDPFQTPMLEPCGGLAAIDFAEAMHDACASIGDEVEVHPCDEPDISLCHRYLGRADGIPAILFETRHISNDPDAHGRTIIAIYTAILAAVDKLGQATLSGPLPEVCLTGRITEPLSKTLVSNHLQPGG